MELATIEAPQSATGTDAEPNLSDRSILQHFIIRNSTSLRDLAYDAGRHNLFFTAPDAIIAKLFSSLSRYGGAAVESDFMHWAGRFVSREAARYEITGRILTEYEDVLHKAIHECLWTSAVDCAVQHEDIYWEIVFLIFQRAHSLDRPGRAKVSTRLYALAKKHIEFYHNNKNAKRRKSVQFRRNEIACERFSDEELAAMKVADADDAAWNPGYAEAGLSLA
jgi:hypothetical protein